MFLSLDVGPFGWLRLDAGAFVLVWFILFSTKFEVLMLLISDRLKLPQTLWMLLLTCNINIIVMTFKMFNYMRGMVVETATVPS